MSLLPFALFDVLFYVSANFVLWLFCLSLCLLIYLYLCLFTYFSLVYLFICLFIYWLVHVFVCYSFVCLRVPRRLGHSASACFGLRGFDFRRLDRKGAGHTTGHCAVHDRGARAPSFFWRTRHFHSVKTFIFALLVLKEIDFTTGIMFICSRGLKQIEGTWVARPCLGLWCPVGCGALFFPLVLDKARAPRLIEPTKKGGVSQILDKVDRWTKWVARLFWNW